MSSPTTTPPARPVPRFGTLFKEAANPLISLEFFPPKQSADLAKTQQVIRRMAQLVPSFMTVTYGAGGGTRDNTRELVSFIGSELSIPAAAHITCVGHSRAELSAILDQYHHKGIRHLVALRGDPPGRSAPFEAHPEGFACARDLVRFIRAGWDFSMAVAGYPETHPDAQSASADIEYLSQKLDAGAELVLTQLFFDISAYTSFVARAHAAGIRAPIVPGLMPVASLAQLERLSKMCSARIPPTLRAELSTASSDPQRQLEIGTAFSVQLARELLAAGAPGLHIYSLNQALQVEQILQKCNYSAE